MTQQEMIEQNVRMLLGDLQLQVIVLKARVAELEEARPNPDKMDGRDSPLPNGAEPVNTVRN